MIDIGNVFRTMGRMLRQRFWGLVGLCAVFAAIQFGGLLVMGVGMAVVGAAGVAAGGAGLEDPAAFAGMGLGLVAILVVFYAAYFVIFLAQQAALVTLASPLEDASFGAAMSRGFKSAMPFFGVVVLLMVAYIAVGALVGGALGATGGGAMLSNVIPLLLLPVMVYFGCRFSVLIPVVAVDKVFNPVKAIRRSWQLTRGHVWRIFLSNAIYTLCAGLLLALPVVLLFGLTDSTGAGPDAALFAVLAIMLLFLPVMCLYFMSLSAFMASLHSEVTGGGAEALEEIFA